MKTYTVNDIRKSIRKVGIKKDDTVFIFPETYKFGILENIQFHKKVYEIFFKVISEIFINNNFDIISTSINKFEKIKNLSELYELEKSYRNVSLEKIKKKKDFPGFFVVVAQKKKYSLHKDI